MNDQKLNLIATSAFGLEAIVSRELKALGYTDQTVLDGRVVFRGDERAICRANLWLRSADRVLVQIGEFPADDFGVLFDETEALPWSDWLTADAAFPVKGKSIRSQLHSVPDCQKLVKKAIVEHLKQHHQTDWFEETGPEFPVEVSILKDRASITIDTSGVGLHKRGYRKLVGNAPLRETLAAALIQLSFWNSDRPFIDPLCGTGTIPIEAALIGRNLAPGLNREFLAESWPRVPKQLWDEARTEARDLATDSLETVLVATDFDEEALSMARYHAKLAGVESDIHFQQKSMANFTTQRKYGCIITNPPYGERLGEQEEAEKLYDEMRVAFSELETWSFYVLTSHPSFENFFRKQATRRRKLYNGRIECTYYQYAGPRPPRPKRIMPDEETNE